jgi:DNA-binding response OmpR family regulator
MKRVLIIDDDAAIVHLLQSVLGRSGFEVTVARNGREGVDKFHRDAFDLVITDVRMPGLSGRAVVSSIRASKRPSTPVLGISGTPWELADGGFDCVLPKPFSMKTLLATLRGLAPRPLSVS